MIAKFEHVPTAEIDVRPADRRNVPLEFSPDQLATGSQFVDSC